MKYVIMQNEAGFKFPVIFPDVLVHSFMAEAAAVIIKASTQSKATAINAGFVNLGKDITCHGKSETLGLEAGPHDEAIIGIGEQGQFMPPEMLEKIWQMAKDHKP